MSNQSIFSGLEAGSFQLIMSDPPWKFATFSDKGKRKSAEMHYECLTIEEIKAMPVADLADPRGCYLWLWATAPMRRQAHLVMDAWGWKYSTEGIWCKTAKKGGLAFGTGHVLRNAHEPFIIAKRGKPPKIHCKSTRSVIMAPRREHSRKPDEAYQAAERLFGDVNRLDMFSRESRPGWTNWGLEATKFNNDNIQHESSAA